MLLQHQRLGCSYEHSSDAYTIGLLIMPPKSLMGLRRESARSTSHPAMTRIRKLSLVGAILLACGVLSLAATLVVTKPRQPNIVLIYVDDLGWKDVGFNGSTYYETPNMDQVASEGISFHQRVRECPKLRAKSCLTDDGALYARPWHLHRR